MPLTDLIRTLNIPHAVVPEAYRRNGLDQPFAAADGRVFLHYANIRLESQFLPIIESKGGRVHGHAASIQAFGMSNKLPLAAETVFVLPTDDAEFVYLDRLVRTLHALNYLTNPIRGNLLLKVHPRHVQSVHADHGLAFEEILRPCGLFPEQITLEINSDRVDDRQHLIRAVANYRARGYGIAIGDFGRSQLDFDLLRELRPDIVKLDRRLLGATPSLKPIIDHLQALPSRILIEGGDRMRQNIVAEGIDLLQSAAPLRRLLQVAPSTPTHASPGWASVKSAA